MKNKKESIKSILKERRREIITVALLALALVLLLFFINREPTSNQGEDQKQIEKDIIVQQEIESINQLRQIANAKNTEEEMQSQMDDINQKREVAPKVTDIDEEVRKQIDGINELRQQRKNK
ncbi:MAG: hypothetical protein XD75_0008 [Parcubacteria bacterium 33_209]|nr:MAG: hypothetical protein XD75_0008 [Parcubacteria bacterium 33_209]